jgi:hypothetical protein
VYLLSEVAIYRAEDLLWANLMPLNRMKNAADFPIVQKVLFRI